MPYLGNTPTTQNFVSGTDYFNGTGSQTAFTLSRTVASVNDIQAVVNNVVQVPNDAYTISGTTITFTSAPSAGTSNVYVRYLSTTTQAITPSQNTVSWSTLDANTQQDLGINNKNRIINGNMVIDQRNAGASFSSSANGAYNLDRWYNQNNSGGTRFTVQQDAGAVTPPAGFTDYLGVTSTSAYTVASTDVIAIGQKIEGFNTADLAFGTASAKTITISFWVRSSLTGTFGGSVSNNDGNRFYAYTYTISAANTWEYKTVTVTGDLTGTWNTTTGAGIQLLFNLGTGSTYTGTAGSWTGSPFYAPTGATSVVGTNGATFYITGVQLEVGTQATTFTTAGGSYGAELALCRRYFTKYYQNTTGVTNDSGVFTMSNWNGTEAYGTNWYQVSMRSAPSFSYSALSDFTWYSNGQTRTPTSIDQQGASADRCEMKIQWSSSIGAGTSGWLRISSSGSGGWISWSAEL
jgi:hypothetical protein